MASSGQERMLELQTHLCAGGLLHPKQDPPGEHPCVLCRAFADLLFGQAGLSVTLAALRGGPPR